jgi:hypothetical protein
MPSAVHAQRERRSAHRATAAAAELAVESVRPFEVASADVVYPLPKWSDLK